MQIDRRQFLGAAAGMAVASALPSRLIAATTAQPTFGLILPLTGASASLGEDMRRGAEMAVDAVNAKGGVLGAPLKLAIEDSAGNAQNALTAAKKLVSVNGAGVVMGDLSSGITVPLREALAREGILHVNYGSSSVALRRPGGGLAFSVIGLDDLIAKFSAKAVIDQGQKKAVIFLPNNAFGKSMSETFAAKYSELGGTIAQSMLYAEGQSSYRRELQQLARHKPDVIVYFAYGQEAAIANREGMELGLKSIPWFGLYVSICAVDSAKETVEGQLGADVNFIGPDSAWYREAYKERYNEDLRSAYNGYVYDAVAMTAEAVNNARKLESQAILSAAKSLSFKGATGTLTLDQDNERAHQAYLLGVVKNGVVNAL